MIKLQPKNQSKTVKSYPYFIYEDGSVGDQDIWQGKPDYLLGFSKKPVAGKMELMMRDFWKEPEKAVGMYPVFQTSTKKWYLEKTKVESVTEQEDMTEEEKKESKLDHLLQDPPPKDDE